MPIYEYRCKDCSHEFETIQKVGARALRKCPECEGRLDKLISKASFQLKGGGWRTKTVSLNPYQSVVYDLHLRPSNPNDPNVSVTAGGLGSSTTQVQPMRLAALTIMRPSWPPPIRPMRATGKG